MGIQRRRDGTTSPSWGLRRLVVRQRRRIAASALLIMLWQACEAFVPVLIGMMIDRAILPGDVGSLVSLTVALCCLFAVLSLSFRAGARMSVRAREGAANQTRQALAAKVLDPRTVVDPARRSGAMASVLGDDCDRVASFLAVIPFAFGACASVVVAGILLLDISTALGLLVLLGCPALLFAVHRLGAPLERRAGVEQSAAAHAAGVATDLISGLRVLKGIGGEAAAAQRYKTASRDSLRATLSSASAEALYDAIAVGATLSFLACVVWVGARPAMDGEIAVGEFVTAVGLSGFLLGPLSRLADLGAAWARANASAARIAAVLNAPARKVAGRRIAASGPGELVVTGPNVSFTAEGGRMLGIVTDHGTAAHLVQVLAVPDSEDADVCVDGVDIADLDPGSASQRLLMARHHEALFSESLWDNVQAGGADPVLVLQALSAVDADQVARTLPDGVNTILAERGSSLSGGQRQRVALARALAADPAVLVLHDPTTAVDTATSVRIAEGVRAMRTGRTTVVIATDPVLLASCDRVLYLADGRVSGAGTHHQLRDRNAGYRELVLA